MDADQLLVRADEAVAAGDWTAVLDLTAQLLDTDPDHADALMLHRTAERQLAKQAPPSERRFLTVMFVDLVGSTALSERLDPEDFAALLAIYHGLVGDAIVPFGGRVVKLLGDGVMAQFGYPVAMEAAPLRAAMAGFAVVDALVTSQEELGAIAGQPVECRVGIHSGTAVVEGGDVVGDVPNVAAAIEGCALPGGVAASSTTKALIEHDYDTEQVVSLKDPDLVAYRLTPRLTRQVVSTHALVGRNAEHEALATAWADVVNGDSRSLVIIGEAGLGKSRLVEELRSLVGDRWIEGGAAEFLSSQPFHLFTDAISRRLASQGIDESNLAAVSVHLATTEERAAQVLSSEDQEGQHPAQVRRAIMKTIVGWIEATARRGPVALALEDLHWADPSSRELIGELSRRTADLPVLTVVTSRTADAVPDIGETTTIALEPLDGDDSLALVSELMREVSGELRALVAERGAGVPLFLTELVRTVADAQIEEHHLPDSLRDLLAARIDSFGPAKRAAQVASVLGRTSSIALVTAVDPELARSDDWLNDLTSGGLLERMNGSVRFGHSLLQDAAYESLLRSERRRLHARAAEAVTQLVVDAPADVVAHHLTEAGETRRAIDSWMDAGRSAASRSASREAVDHFRRAEELVGQLEMGPQRDAIELTLQQAIASPLTAVYGYAAPEVEAAYTRAASLGAASGDVDQEFATIRGLASTRLLRAEVDDAHLLAEDALEIAERSNDDNLLLEAEAWLGTAEFFAGRLDEARSHLDAASGMYDDTRHRGHGIRFGLDPLALSDTHRAWLFQITERPDEALALVESAVAHAREIDHPLSIAHCLNYLAGVHQMHGNHAAQLEVAREEVAIAVEYGFTHYIHYGGIFLGHAEASLGDPAGVNATIASLEARLAAGAALAQPYHHWLIADAQRRHKQARAAAESLERARDVAERTSERWWLPMILIGSGADV